MEHATSWYNLPGWLRKVAHATRKCLPFESVVFSLLSLYCRQSTIRILFVLLWNLRCPGVISLRNYRKWCRPPVSVVCLSKRFSFLPLMVILLYRRQSVRCSHFVLVWHLWCANGISLSNYRQWVCYCSFTHHSSLIPLICPLLFFFKIVPQIWDTTSVEWLYIGRDSTVCRDSYNVCIWSRLLNAYLADIHLSDNFV